MSFNLNGSQIDIFLDGIIAHEKLITDNDDELLFADNVGRWRGFPAKPSMLPKQSPYLWIWQGKVHFNKKSIENVAADGHCDIQFILAQYLERFENGEMRTDIMQSRNQLVKKFEVSLIDSRHADIAKDTMVYDTGKAYFISGPNIIDTEDFYIGGIGQIFPLTGKAVPDNWYISVLTSTIYFNNRN